MFDPNKTHVPDPADEYDEKILLWEQRRKTMPPDDQLDTEYEECEGLQVAA
jgi:hypothetical protein